MQIINCPNCNSDNLSVEYGDDLHGNYGEVFTCRECFYTWEEDSIDEMF